MEAEKRVSDTAVGSPKKKRAKKKKRRSGKIEASAVQPLPPGFIRCPRCQCPLNPKKGRRHESRCPKRARPVPTPGSSTRAVPMRAPAIASAPLPRAPVPPKPQPTFDTPPSSRQPRATGRGAYARPYFVGPDGTVGVMSSRASLNENEARARLRDGNRQAVRDPLPGEDLRDATRYSGHSFRDHKGEFGSHPVHDAFDDESDPE